MSRAGNCDGRQRRRIERHREARSGEAGRETELPGDGGVGRQPVQPVHQIAGDDVGPDLRVIHAVAAADRQALVAARVPAEADARREVRRGVGQGLTVVAEPEVDREVGVQAECCPVTNPATSHCVRS